MIRTACSRGSNNAWHAIRRTVRLRGDRGAEELRQGRDPPRHRPLDAQPEPSALEERLGARLLNRTTRSVALTEAGARLLARVRPAFCELAAATAEAAGDPHKPTGLLRLAVQPPVANLMIAPMLARFMHAHPGIQLDIAVIRMPGDIVREGFDAGIRFGEQVERDMIAMQVMGEARFLVVAAPDYLARHAPPNTPRDLRDHACIRNRLPNGAVFGWDFHKGRRVIHAAVEGRLVVNDIELSIRAVLDGLGLYRGRCRGRPPRSGARGLDAAPLRLLPLSLEPAPRDARARGIHRLRQGREPAEGARSVGAAAREHSPQLSPGRCEAALTRRSRCMPRPCIEKFPVEQWLRYRRSRNHSSARLINKQTPARLSTGVDAFCRGRKCHI
jgi:DNA-binding transcriptional LysR family regulator